MGSSNRVFHGEGEQHPIRIVLFCFVLLPRIAHLACISRRIVARTTPDPLIISRNDHKWMEYPDGESIQANM